MKCNKQKVFLIHCYAESDAKHIWCVEITVQKSNTKVFTKRNEKWNKNSKRKIYIWIKTDEKCCNATNIRNTTDSLFSYTKAEILLKTFSIIY